MRTVIDYRRTIGPAAWLLLLYWQHSTPTNDPAWTVVADGEAIHDSDAAKILKVSLQTAVRWRRRLREAGLIFSHASGREGFRIWLLRFDQETAGPAQTRVLLESLTEMPTQMVQ